MYTIYSDGRLVYAPHLSDAGCGVFTPKLTVELNKAGSLAFVMPPDNVMYNSINKLSSIITVEQDGEELFRGRVLNDEKDFYNQKKNYCEGELAFLIDSIQRPYTYTGTVGDLFRKFITYHNSRVETSKRFTVGTVSVSSANKTITVAGEDYPSTMDAITEKLLDVYGGYLVTRGSGSTRYIDWVETSGEDNTQSIEFGMNLLDVTEYISGENLFTVLVPVGKRLTDNNGDFAGYVDITSVNGGTDYIENSTAVSLFGRIEASESWSDIEDPSELKTVAQEYLEQCIELAITLSVKAIDLNLLDVKYERIRLGDWVRVISPPHDLDKWFQCTKIVYDLIDPEKTEYVFGVDFTSFTDKQTENDKNSQASSNKADAATDKANQAMGAVSSLPSQEDYNDLVARIEELESNPGISAETYSGAYTVTPSSSEQTLETASKLMEDDVTVKEIPYYDVSNTSGGSTVYIGTEV